LKPKLKRFVQGARLLSESPFLLFGLCGNHTPRSVKELNTSRFVARLSDDLVRERFGIRRLGFMTQAAASSGIEIRQRMFVENSADVIGDHHQMKFTTAFRAAHGSLRWNFRNRSLRQHVAPAEIEAHQHTDIVEAQRTVPVQKSVVANSMQIRRQRVLQKRQ
jgi:hypothetical protein